MDSSSLFLGQFLAIGVIHAGLMLALLWVNRHYRETPFFLAPFSAWGEWWHPVAMRLALGVLAGGLAMGLSLLALVAASGTFTLMVLNAGLLTLWYLELGLLLGRRFFPGLFDGDLPREICLFVSFVLVTNGGYFTLMFIAALFRARTL